jgi:hypothetical protein
VLKWNRAAGGLLVLISLVWCGPVGAERTIGLDLGYISTTSDDWGRGLVYGGHLIEGSGRFGFGLTAHRFSNSIAYESGNSRFEEEFYDFFVTIMPTWIIRGGERRTHLTLGLGPQIHMVSARKFYVTEGTSRSVRESRLGVGGVFEYKRKIWAFADAAIVLTAVYSWVERGKDFDPLDEYRIPAPSFNAITLVAGLAFPF